MDLEVILADLRVKLPCLQHILRPEYIPYLNTAGTVLLGWLVVSTLSQILWSLLAPVVASVVTIILICPATTKWCFNQLGPNVEIAMNELSQKLETFLANFRIQPA